MPGPIRSNLPTAPAPQPGRAPQRPPQPGPAAQPWQPPQQQPGPAAQPYNPGTTIGVPQPVYIPNSMAEKYKHFEDVVDLGMTAYGEDVTLADGSQAFQLHEIAEDSPLSTRLGFQPGDTIISVNGYPASKGNARQLYETLKSDKTFNVVIQRGGQQQTMTYHIQ